MVKQIIKFLAFVVAALSASAHAQCVPQKGPYIDQNGFVADQPRHIDPSRGGCYVPQGTPRLDSQTTNQQVGNTPIWGNGAGQQVIAVQQPYQNQQVMVGQQSYIPWGQAATARVQVLEPPCQVVEKTAGEWVVGVGASAIKGLVIGTGAGYVARGIAGHDNNYGLRGRQVGAGAGLVSGALNDQKLDCSERDAFRAERRAIALERQAVNQPQTLVQQGQNTVQQVQGRARIPCTDLGQEGKFHGILNLPGHEYHNREICAFPDDRNVSRWLQ